MICPQTKQECGCQSLLTCTLSSRDPSRSCLDVVTPPPTLAEIERLVDEVEICVLTTYVARQQGTPEANIESKNAYLAARAALMAAIRAYGRE